MDHSPQIIKALGSWIGRTDNDRETLMRAHYMVQKALFFLKQFNNPKDTDYAGLLVVKELLDNACPFSGGDPKVNQPVYEWAAKQSKVVACAHASQIREALCQNGLISFTTTK